MFPYFMINSLPTFTARNTVPHPCIDMKWRPSFQLVATSKTLTQVSVLLTIITIHQRPGRQKLTYLKWPYLHFSHTKFAGEKTRDQWNPEYILHSYRVAKLPMSPSSIILLHVIFKISNYNIARNPWPLRWGESCQVEIRLLYHIPGRAR